MHTAATALYGSDGFFANSTDRHGGTGPATLVTAPIAAGAGIIGGVTPHLHLYGLVLFLLAMWVLVRVAGFRFVIATGVG